jgi:hypothetical protein
LEQTIFTIIVTSFLTYLTTVAVKRLDRRNVKEDKQEEREEDVSKEQIISDRMIAERMMEKVDRQEVLIGTLRDNLSTKDAENAVLKLRIEYLQDEIRRLRGEHINVE